MTTEGCAFNYRSGVGVPVSRVCLCVGGSRFGRRIRRCVDGCPPPSCFFVPNQNSVCNPGTPAARPRCLAASAFCRTLQESITSFLSSHGCELMLSLLVGSIGEVNTAAQDGPPDRVRWGDGCRHVFLDVGANIGIQTRKLYEPDAYVRKDGSEHEKSHNFSWVAAFQSAFDDRRRVCSFAFEANERHTTRLKSLQACYKRQGYRAHFFTETAAADKNGNLSFYRDPVFASKQEWAASLMKHGKSGHKMPRRTVAAVDLAAWIRYHILQRRIPRGEGEPRILMKLDIEAAEFQVLPRMLELGAFCNDDSSRRMHLVVLEWHLQFVSQVNGRQVPCISLADCRQASQVMQKVREISAASQITCSKFVEADDDSYMFDSALSLNLSTCSSN